MSKLLKIGGIIIAVLAVVYLFFIVFVSPSTENDPETVAAYFFDNIAEDDICTASFNPETVSFCEAFQTSLESETFTYDLTTSGTRIIATITIDSNEDTFTMTFIEEDNTGIGGFFHSTNYYIDTIE